MKNKTKTITGNKKPSKIAKKKTPPREKTLLSQQKKTPTPDNANLHKKEKELRETRIRLRLRAEEMARKIAAQSKKQEALSPENTRKTFHELQVHQIELEMQNEEMTRTQVELDAARARYFDLFDLAPVGYCTISEKELILESNLTAATLLGVVRSKLVKQFLTRFILKEDLNIYYLHRKQLLDNGEPQTCELRMVKKDGSAFWAHLTGIAAKNEDGTTVCRVVISDITGIKQTESQREAAIEALRKNETQLRSTLEAAADGILAVDNKGNIVQANRRFSDLWRIPHSLIDRGDDRALLDFVLSQLTDPDAFLKKVQLLYDSDAEDMNNITFKDGRLFERYSLPMIMDGIRIGRVWSFRDITERKQAEKLLKESETKYRLLADHMQDAIGLLDLNLKMTYISPSTERLLGYTLEEIGQLPLNKLLTTASLHTVMDVFSIEMAKAIKDPPPSSYKRLLEYECRCKDGRIIWIESSFSFIMDEKGKPLSILGEGRDITERKQMEEKLHREEQLFRALAEQSYDIILLVNREGIITYENPAVEKILGFKAEERIGTSIFDHLHPDDFKLITDASDTLFGDTTASVQKSEIHLRHRDGSWRTVEATGSNLVHDNVVEAVIVNLRDITERKLAESQRDSMLEALRESEQKYLELSMIDDLTQLYNSRHFYDQLKKETERSNRHEQPLTLLLLDLDKFKNFNDTYGHVEGDSVLSRLGQVIKRCLRETDSAYRYGGEEFTILLPMTTSEESLVTAKRIQMELKKEAFSPVSGQAVYMTISIGLAQYKPKEEVKAFVQRVDQLMYKVKKNERGKICSDDGNVQ